MVTIDKIPCGSGNCFLIQGNAGAILVDTARTRFRDQILQVCKDKNVKLIILTHGHLDHTQNAAYLSEQLNAPIAIHKDDLDLSKDNTLRPLFADGILGKLLLYQSKRLLQKERVEPFYPTRFLQDGDSLQDLGINAKVVGLPGHTKGSIGVLVEDSDFIVGDALMNLYRPSRAVLYEDREAMEASAAKISCSKVKTLHFGHGESAANGQW